MQSILAEIERSKAELVERGEDAQKEEGDNKGRKAESDEKDKRRERERERGRGRMRSREDGSPSASPRHARAVSDDVQVPRPRTHLTPAVE